jgi:hypothetical protein
VPGVRAPAFIATIVACGVAIWFARDRVSALTRPTTPERPYVVATAIWAFGIIALTVGITWVGGGLDNPVRWALILGGLAVLIGAVVHDRRRTQPLGGPVRIERRPVTVAIFAGIVIAVAQTAPMLQLPLYFHLALGYGPLLAVVAIGPLFAALVLAGPVAGFLLGRFSPRSLVGPGLIVVGLADLLLWLVATPSAGYLAFVIPCLLVGAGFVIATTVRTAIIFASVPRGLPATAAALNEASISVGARVGIEHLLDPADRVERASKGVLLRLGVDPPVGRVGEQLVGRLLAGARDPVAPGGGRHRCAGRRHRATADLRPCIVAATA